MDKTRFYSLDALRGAAALGVILYHWSHFFSLQIPAPASAELMSPLYALLHPFYTYGWVMVDAFFCISGYVFFRLYADTIVSGQESVWAFFVKRGARLYPLHIITLICVALLQAAYLQQAGKYFVYAFNDPPHFFYNLLFLQCAPPVHGASFNSPSWSIAVEVYLYIGFFALCRWGALRHTAVLLLIAGAGLVLESSYPLIGRGLCGFFLGGLAYRIHVKLSARSDRRSLEAAILSASAVFFTSVVIASYGFSLSPAFYELESRIVLVIGWPLLVLSAVRLEPHWAIGFKRLSWLGDISFSLYLWHFPLQLIFALLTAHGVLPAAAYRSPLTLLAFFGVLLPLAWLSRHYIETPLQDRLRALALRPRRGKAFTQTLPVN